MPEYLSTLLYLVAASLFIVGLKGLAHPRTAVRGNLLGATGMLLAVVVTATTHRLVSPEIVVLAMVAGAAIGVVLALRVQMTAMPQMVAMLNGFGGAASALVAGGALAAGDAVTLAALIAAAASGLVGGVTLWGSLVAFGKLQGVIPEGQILFPLQQALTAAVAAAAVAGGVWMVMGGGELGLYLALVAVASLLGILLVIPIGGADMPVVIALLNSYSGIAAAMTGFVLDSSLLIIGGSLVGASGIILTNIMCKAMNRSLTNVMFGVLGPSPSSQSAGDIYAGRVKATSAEEVAMLFETARRVAVIPGYGMAVAQAQYAVRDLSNLLVAKGIEVEFAIHPVAGRMPGHMNVLLAEAGIPYEQLKEAEQINPTMGEVDVTLIIGANDVVNPVARTDPTSPIAGMPIVDADKSRTVVVIKRSLSPGFAGIPNPLFAADNCLMFFADAKKAVSDVNSALRDLGGAVRAAAD